MFPIAYDGLPTMTCLLPLRAARLLTILAVVLASVPAQDPPISAEKAAVLRLEAEREEAVRKAGKLQVEAAPIAKPVPKAPLEVKGAKAGVVRFESSCSPKKLAPGGMGTITVVMAFVGDTVMLDPPPMTFQTEARQASIGLGVPVFRAVKSAGRAPALKGRAAFDDYAIFDVPITVDAYARPALYPVKLAFTYQLHDGKTGGTREPYSDEIEIEISVQNPPVAEPEAAALAGPKVGGSSAPAAANALTAGANKLTGPVHSAPDAVQSAEVGVGAPAGRSAAEDTQAPALDATESRLGGLALAGLALVAVAVLLWRRGRAQGARSFSE